MAPPGVGDTRVDEQGVYAQGIYTQQVDEHRCRAAYERAGCGMYRIPPSGVCAHPGCCLRVLSQCLVLQVFDCLISAHVLISHELLDAVGVHVHVFLAAEGTNLGANTVGDFTLNAVAQV